MHFRIRGNSVQIVKTTPDAKGKAVSTPVGSMNLNTLQLADTVKSACSKAELREIEAWVARYRHVQTLQQEVAGRTASTSLQSAAALLATLPEDEAVAVYEDIKRAFQGVRAAAKKRGIEAKA